MVPKTDPVLSLALLALAPGQAQENRGAALLHSLADMFNAVAALMEAAPNEVAEPRARATEPAASIEPPREATDHPATADKTDSGASSQPGPDGDWLTIPQARLYLQQHGATVSASTLRNELAGLTSKGNKRNPPIFVPGTDCQKHVHGGRQVWVVRRGALDRRMGERLAQPPG